MGNIILVMLAGGAIYASFVLILAFWDLKVTRSKENG